MNHRPLHPTRPTCALLLAAATAFATAQPAPSAAERYNQAHEQYEIGHYNEAFVLFAALADQGHCDAARIAQQMARYGQSLYFTTFEVTKGRLEQWQRLPGCAAVRVAR